MTLRHALEYSGVVVGLRLIRSLPLPAARRLAERAAAAYFDRGGRRVGYALENLRIAYPDLAEE